MDFFLHPIKDSIALNEIHFIVQTINQTVVKAGIRKALKKFGITSAILSIIRIYKHNCITKEKYEEMYKTNEKNEERMNLSVGDDLEDFIGRIKTGRAYGGFEDFNESFLLCLLNKAERKKLEQKDEAFMETFHDHVYGSKADVPEAEWQASESNLKFARSECYRNTETITTNNSYEFISRLRTLIS